MFDSHGPRWRGATLIERNDPHAALVDAHEHGWVDGLPTLFVIERFGRDQIGLLPARLVCQAIQRVRLLIEREADGAQSFGIGNDHVGSERATMFLAKAN